MHRKRRFTGNGFQEQDNEVVHSGLNVASALKVDDEIVLGGLHEHRGSGSP